MLASRFTRPSLTSRQDVPGDGVCDSGEDPIQLSQGSSPVIQSARNPASGEKTQGGFLLVIDFFLEIHMHNSQPQPKPTKD